MTRWSFADRAVRMIAVSLLAIACHEADHACLLGGDGPGTGGDVEYGETCEASDECVSGLVCAGDAVCRAPGEPGTAGDGDPCVSSQFCELGLVCDNSGECAQAGSPGTAGLGEECATTDDCRLGYLCKEDACYGLDLPVWLGAECAQFDDGDPRAYFEVPRGTPLDEFYRLPFPNDIRVQSDGTLDLEGHPSPGVLIPALGDVVGTVLATASEEFDGFGPNQAVIMRFSHQQDVGSVNLGNIQQGATASLVDITPGSPDYGTLVASRMRTGTARQTYHCQNWITFHASPGRPLVPGNTYAAIVTTGVTADDGTPLAQDADFTAVMSASTPGDAQLVAAWNAYQPLRDWLGVIGVSTDTIASAAVFTIGDPTVYMDLLADAVAAAPAPDVDGVHLCTSDPGPYANASDPDRGCFGDDPLYHEIQGTLPIPQYQFGLPPFKDLDDGGTIDFDSGVPVPARTDDVHWSLTLPKVATPSAGWPVVVYAHGTGANYRSPIDSGLAADWADITLDDNSHVHFAVLTIDAHSHGPVRSHPENWKDEWLSLDPDAYGSDVLFYNPLNPPAARDNALQAAADYLYVIRLAESLFWSAGESPTGSQVYFDPDNIYLVGHSQGASTMPMVLPYADSVHAGVISAGGGLFIESLLNKVSPFDIPAMVSVGLADPDLSRNHPLLNIAQLTAERSDPVNFGAFAFDAPLAGHPPHHVFQVSGVGDTYTPDDTQFPLARSMGVQQITGPNTPMDFIQQVNPPVSGNREGSTITGVVRLYSAQGNNDAHFVLFDRSDTPTHVGQFLGTAVRDGIPTVVP